jgi:hypothetical protein
MRVAKRRMPDPSECYLCGAVFSEDANPPTTSHVIARGWFGTPPPENLPTMPACHGCNNVLSAREERLRNAFVRMFSHDAATHRGVREKASRSRQRPPRETSAGYSKTSGGILAPSVVFELPDAADVEPVFRGITRGLYYKLLGRLLPQDVPIHSVLLQERDAGPISRKTIEAGRRIFTLGNEFSFAPVVNGENPHDSVWLYLVFNAGVVASFTGVTAQLQFPPARESIGERRAKAKKGAR